MSASGSEEHKDDQWEEAMQEHSDLVAKIKKGKGKKSQPLNIEQCKGSYVIRCDQLSSEWDNCDELSIDIDGGATPNILVAAVDFGIYECTMLLAVNEAELDTYVKTADKNEDSECGESDQEVPQSTASKKRKAPPPKRGRGRPKKQPKTSDTTSKRLFFRMRGRDTSEGQIFYAPEKGHLDFTDDDFVAFKGIMALPAVGREVPLEGFKINAKAMSSAEAWSSFSEKAYEEERVSRWG
jgi:hypothetical protein